MSFNFFSKKSPQPTSNTLTPNNNNNNNMGNVSPRAANQNAEIFLHAPAELVNDFIKSETELPSLILSFFNCKNDCIVEETFIKRLEREGTTFKIILKNNCLKPDQLPSIKCISTPALRLTNERVLKQINFVSKFSNWLGSNSIVKNNNLNEIATGTLIEVDDSNFVVQTQNGIKSIEFNEDLCSIEFIEEPPCFNPIVDANSSLEQLIEYIFVNSVEGAEINDEQRFKVSWDCENLTCSCLYDIILNNTGNQITLSSKWKIVNETNRTFNQAQLTLNQYKSFKEVVKRVKPSFFSKISSVSTSSYDYDYDNNNNVNNNSNNDNENRIPKEFASGSILFTFPKFIDVPAFSKIFETYIDPIQIPVSRLVFVDVQNEYFSNVLHTNTSPIICAKTFDSIYINNLNSLHLNLPNGKTSVLQSLDGAASNLVPLANSELISLTGNDALIKIKSTSEFITARKKVSDFQHDTRRRVIIESFEINVKNFCLSTNGTTTVLIYDQLHRWNTFNVNCNVPHNIYQNSIFWTFELLPNTERLFTYTVTYSNVI
eukprot:TRINITY_DN1526_c0_g1_i1.p1 TRINITY_DN1526_c0_g1~~TRINITY_DN1526_c0_g1_i1.p1  ORF type:complete len:545 (-),score=204.40 TRINITY_DN1526_c0_g1_i1:6-1640(-)